MGFYLSRAKWAEKYGQRHRMRAALRRSFVPAVLHGLYDFLLMGFETVFYFYFAGLVIGVIACCEPRGRADLKKQPSLSGKALRGAIRRHDLGGRKSETMAKNKVPTGGHRLP